MYNQVELKCNKAGCKKAVTADSRGEASKKAAAAGWQLKSASEHYCPDHRSAPAGGGKKAKAGKGGKTPTKKAKLVSKPAVRGVISFGSTDKPN